MGISSSLGSSALLPAGLGFRNVLINGDFRVWQRGTSFTVTSGSPYTADRWCVTLGGAANFSVTRQTASLDGFQYCLRLQRTAANTNTSALYLSQPVETVNSVPLANKQITFSFYARAGANFSAASSALNVRIVTGTGTDGNYLVATLTGQAFQLDTTATLTTSWQRFTYSVLIPSGVNQVQPVFFYTPVGTAGAADNFDVTGVQLEQNYQPTPFEQRPIGVELALCQRYYWKSYPQDKYAGDTTTSNNKFTVNNATFGAAFPQYVFPVVMRGTPTCTPYDEAGASGKCIVSGVGNNVTCTIGDPNQLGFRFSQASGYTGGAALFGFFLIASAEL
jgi:hypothetical protein